MASGRGANTDELRIILIGHTGHGKSATGNTILGRIIFKAKRQSESVTTTSKHEKCKRFGRNVLVVDTPGLFDTKFSHAQIQKELLKSLVLSVPGFHAIAFVLRPDRFTIELQQTRDIFFEWFGERTEKYTLMILTHTRNEDGVNEYFQTAKEDLRKLRHMCGDIVVPFENKAELELKEQQVRHLFHCIDDMVSKNNGNHFSNPIYDFAESYARNKYSLTKNSIRLLTSAGMKLSEVKEQTGSAVVTTRPKGNLTIINESKSGGIYIENPSRSEPKSTEIRQRRNRVVVHDDIYTPSTSSQYNSDRQCSNFSDASQSSQYTIQNEQVASDAYEDFRKDGENDEKFKWFFKALKAAGRFIIWPFVRVRRWFQSNSTRPETEEPLLV